MVGGFVNADPDRDVVVFAKNTTEAINKLARTMPMSADAVVLTTLLEHHSNDLPWRARARTVHVRACPDGSLDEEDLDRQLQHHAGRIALLAVSGASNVTGLVQPIHRLAERVHAAGGRILVDAAQLAPHRRSTCVPTTTRVTSTSSPCRRTSCTPRSAPARSSARGPRSGRSPTDPGGGTVHAVTVEDVAWADLPDREEAGSPNVVGAVALAAAVETLTRIGRDCIAAHEAELLRLRDGAPRDRPRPAPPRAEWPDRALASRVGVIPFTLDGLDHALVAAILGYEHGDRGAERVLLRPPLHVPPARPRWRRSGGRGCGGPAAATSAGHRAWCASASVATTTRPTSTAPSTPSSQIAAGEYAGAYRCDEHGDYRPVDYREPSLFALGGIR